MEDIILCCTPLLPYDVCNTCNNLMKKEVHKGTHQFWGNQIINILAVNLINFTPGA